MTNATQAIYFASTSLELRRADPAANIPRDLFEGDVCFRRVEPEYFAWLRSRMVAARGRFESGRLPQAKWDELRGRFNRLQEWATQQYGMAALQEAVRQLRPARYAPPVNRQPPPYCHPATGDWRFSHPVMPEAVGMVDAIREEALAKGWTEARLYQNRGRFRFPLGEDYGLVCFVGPGDELGEVAEAHIEIIHGRPGNHHALRFANTAVFSPRAQRESVTR